MRPINRCWFLMSFLLCAACDGHSSRRYLGCSWNIEALTEHEAGVYRLPFDSEAPRYVSLEFHQEPFHELGEGFELVEETQVAVLKARRYRTEENISSNAEHVLLVQREGHDGFVTIFNGELDEFLIGCD